MAGCPSCGQENPAGARFCQACAAPLTHAPAAHEVRKTVTVVFSDIVDSTPLGERLDPESLRRGGGGVFSPERPPPPGPRRPPGRVAGGGRHARLRRAAAPPGEPAPARCGPPQTP